MSNFFERFILGMSCLVVAASTYGLIRGVSDIDSGDVGGQTPVAHVTVLSNNAKRKLNQHASWNSLEQGQALYYRDVIFVDPNSSMTLQLDDGGSELHLGENTLLVLDIRRDAKKKDADLAEVRLIRGDVAVEHREVASSASPAAGGAKGSSPVSKSKSLQIVLNDNTKISLDKKSMVALSKRDEKASIFYGGGDVSLSVKSKDTAEVKQVAINSPSPRVLQDLDLKDSAAFSKLQNPQTWDEAKAPPPKSNSGPGARSQFLEMIPKVKTGSTSEQEKANSAALKVASLKSDDVKFDRPESPLPGQGATPNSANTTPEAQKKLEAEKLAAEQKAKAEKEAAEKAAEQQVADKQLAEKKIAEKKEQDKKAEEKRAQDEKLLQEEKAKRLAAKKKAEEKKKFMADRAVKGVESVNMNAVNQMGPVPFTFSVTSPQPIYMLELSQEPSFAKLMSRIDVSSEIKNPKIKGLLKEFTFKISPMYLTYSQDFLKNVYKYRKIYFRIVPFDDDFEPAADPSKAPVGTITFNLSKVAELMTPPVAYYGVADQTINLKWTLKNVVPGRYQILISDSKEFQKTLCTQTISRYDFKEGVQLKKQPKLSDNDAAFNFAFNDEAKISAKSDCPIEALLKSRTSLYYKILTYDPADQPIAYSGDSQPKLLQAKP